MKTLTFTLLLALICSFGFSQKQEVFRIDSLPKQGILLDKGWKWHAGDNPDWAKPDFDDAKWENINPTHQIKELQQIDTRQPLWLRLTIDNQSNIKNLLMSIKQSGATAIFINGKVVKYIGKIDSKNQYSIAYDPLNEFSIINLNVGKNTFAVRYFFQKNLRYNTLPSLSLPLFSTLLSMESHHALLMNEYFWDGFNMAVALILFLIHFIYFVSYPPLKTNLWYSLFALCWLTMYYLLYKMHTSHSVETKTFYSSCHLIIDQSRAIFLFVTIFLFLKQTQKWVLATLISISLLSIVFNLLFYFEAIWIVNFCTILVYGYFIMYLGNNAQKQGIEGGRYINWGVIGYIIFWFLFVLAFTFKWPTLSRDILFHTAVLIIPITISALLGLNFKSANKQIINNLEQINALSAEKQQILSTQNETLEKQVEARTAELKTSQNQLIQKEKLASLGELTAGIAHEIQNPLNFVNNFSEMSVELAQELKEEAEKPEIDKELIIDLATDLAQNQAKINLHGKRASSIVSGMLEHSRASTGERVLTDINKLADEYLRLSYHGIRAKDNSFNSDYKTDFDENLPKIEVIPQDMGRVLLNLINNAFWATNQRNLQGFKNLTGLNDYNPTVTISTQKSDNQVIIKVTDNGTGMSDEIKAKIFQPFFTTKPTGQGTGLGLSLAYDIVTKGHGGTIEVQSKQGEGSEFIITLPMTTN